MINPINRRTFLRASGVAMALPLLESMSPALARATSTAPRRMVNICNTLGLYSESWFPKRRPSICHSSTSIVRSTPCFLGMNMKSRVGGNPITLRLRG